METFNVIAGACSILSLLVSLFVASKVYKIGSISTVGSQSALGTSNKLAGRDVNA